MSGTTTTPNVAEQATPFEITALGDDLRARKDALKPAIEAGEVTKPSQETVDAAIKMGNEEQEADPDEKSAAPRPSLGAVREIVAAEYAKMLASHEVFFESFETIATIVKKSTFPESAMLLRFVTWRDQLSGIIYRDTSLMLAEVGSLIERTGVELELRELRTFKRAAEKAVNASSKGASADQAKLDKAKAARLKAEEALAKATQAVKDAQAVEDKANGHTPEAAEEKSEPTPETPKAGNGKAKAVEPEKSVEQQVKDMPEAQIEAIGVDRERLAAALKVSNDETPVESPEMAAELAKPAPAKGNGRNKR